MGVLRIFLALSVVNAHSGYVFGFPLLLPDFSVQAFYIISGFYMALVLHEKYQPENSTYFDFISNRFLRIFPSYFLVLALTILLFFAYGLYSGKVFGPSLQWARNWAELDWSTRFFLVLSHLSLFGQDAYLFLGLDRLGGLQFDPDWYAHHNSFFRFMLIPQAWSLSLELYFYLLAPFLVRRSATILAMMILASLTVRFMLAYWLNWKGDPWSYRFFPSELALFLCGAVAYKIYRIVRTREMQAQNWVGLGALGVAAGSALLIDRDPSEGLISLNAGLVVTMVIILPFLFKLTQHSKIDHYIGELSYPIYLCHMLVIFLFMLFGIQNGVAKGAGIFSITLLLSVVLYWGVDRNVDNYRHRKFSAAHKGKHSSN